MFWGTIKSKPEEKKELSVEDIFMMGREAVGMAREFHEYCNKVAEMVEIVGPRIRNNGMEHKYPMTSFHGNIAYQASQNLPRFWRDLENILEYFENKDSELSDSDKKNMIEEISEFKKRLERLMDEEKKLAEQSFIKIVQVDKILGV
jgi:hypothetical protein